MDELILLPFTKYESKHDYSTITFNERGVDFTILRNSVHNRPQSGNLYKFGLIDTNGNYYWFFNGKALIKGRIKALETFNALKQYCYANKLGKPFAYKVVK
jgi:hypothetical protein